jgi:hypothetical protein
MSVFVNPLAGDPVVLVTAVGAAEGSRGAAAALACAGADVERATLLIEVGGRPPRPTLVASSAAQKLEERLAAHLPKLRLAARGHICQLAVAAEEGGLALAASAVTAARGSLAVVHLPPALLRLALEGASAPRATGALLRADLAADRALLALAARELIGRGLAIGVLKRRLGWLVERRALFGALPAETAGGLPPALVDRLAPPARAAGPERVVGFEAGYQ